MSALSIYAGPVAHKLIRERGFDPELFTAMYGASGGPKWFILFALDRYLFGEFFAGRTKPLFTIGSSAGAWRLGCLAAADPVAAITRLAERYSHERYSERPDIREITDSAERMVRHVFTDEDMEAIVDNPVFRTHVLVDRARGLGSSSLAPLQALHLGLSAGANAISRRSLAWFYRRCVFCPDPGSPAWPDLSDLATDYYPINRDNFFLVMLATGSIPFVLESVRDIPDARAGVYWDGGITDYHLDLPRREGEGLVLYPHFTADIIPGWFDKKLPWRRVRETNFDKVVLLCPSRQFVDSLPYGKISDRSDFKQLSYEQRLPYWQEILGRSQLLADAFSRLVENGEGLEQIKPLGARPGR